ncbi:bifunctional ADP-dependent NAD(P)H-hydrate dehydratase/NAD(P)H-hydrate epimerase [Massilia sp. Leaf139]|uniref:bifunctional ADP-dependent NAD(P)H-hydrate dehydratase/NAD(P)H-hydrate epimerase n=1 Tax=Massilia sp. Leaf139 TaxID=1736272 RepID=UPI0006F295B4|nr:bifunctional ADP-dependent NAD(P)H-hydrate dehydratase/NAD(P)H-hydrate epimerase [Massilia sp. Leaf139]KQQ97471.1 sugar kinase [Massilia sp. Leaf139]
MDTRLYSVAQIRAIEAAAAASLEPGTLMRRAGRAAADAALALLGSERARPVLVLAGPGNNGGDALEVAANLAEAGADVVVLHLAGSGKVSPEAAQALARARASRANFADVGLDVRDWALVVDGLFGIGLERPLEGRYRELVTGIDRLACPVLALDVPSGLDADSGAIVGNGVAVRATHTITFIGDKPGLHTAEGRDHAGAVQVADLELESNLYEPAQASIASPALFAPYLAPRRLNSHKGQYGDVAVIGGAHGMAGAAILAARAALYAGAGRVFAAMLGPALALDPLQPELMLRAAHDVELAGRVLVLGPGMGGAMEAMRVLGAGIDGTTPIVIDADGLNLVAASLELQERAARRQEPTVVTPHPLEAARLLGITAVEVQADRLGAARTLAKRLQAVVVLKGCGTVLARPDGEVAVNPTGNPGLATGGSGDVLAGVCGALLAQGWPAWEAAVGAVWMHGAAADRLVQEGIGPVGMTAGELPAAVRAVFNGLVKQHAAGRS